jgi:hypothetical protein
MGLPESTGVQSGYGVTGLNMAYVVASSFMA